MQVKHHQIVTLDDVIDDVTMTSRRCNDVINDVIRTLSSVSSNIQLKGTKQTTYEN